MFRAIAVLVLLFPSTAALAGQLYVTTCELKADSALTSIQTSQHKVAIIDGTISAVFYDESGEKLAVISGMHYQYIPADTRELVGLISPVPADAVSCDLDVTEAIELFDPS